MAAVTAAYLLLRTAVLGFTFVRLEGLGTNRHPIAMTRAFLIRSFLPQSGLALTVFVHRFDVLVGVPLVVMLVWGQARTAITPLLLIALCLGMALAPVLPLSISLNDTQSERLIYMASAFAMLGLVGSSPSRHNGNGVVAVVTVLAVGNLLMLDRFNANWREASEIIDQSLPSFAASIRAHGRSGRPIVFVNVPDNVRGAYVFRRGFPEALRLAAPDQLAALADLTVLSVYTVTDATQAVRLTTAGPKSVEVDLGGGVLIGSAGPPTSNVKLRDWATQTFGLDFTARADGSLILDFAPRRVEVFDMPTF